MERHLGPIQQIHLVILKLQDQALPLPLRRAGEEVFAMLVIKTYCPATLGISVSSCAYTCSMANWPVELVSVITICRMHRMPPDLMKTALLQSSSDYLFLTKKRGFKVIIFSRNSTASLLFLARDFFSPAIPRAKRLFATTLCQLRFTSRGAGRPFPSLPSPLEGLWASRRAATGARRHLKPPCRSAGLGLAAARPEGCEGPRVNRGSWSHSMVWRAHGTRQMQLQLLLGREHQPPSLGHMKDWFSLWQDGVKLPFFSWSLPHLQSSKEPQPPVHRPGDKKITYIKDYAFAVTGEFCFWSLKLHSGKKKRA